MGSFYTVERTKKMVLNISMTIQKTKEHEDPISKKCYIGFGYKINTNFIKNQIGINKKKFTKITICLD